MTRLGDIFHIAEPHFLLGVWIDKWPHEGDECFDGPVDVDEVEEGELLGVVGGEDVEGIARGLVAISCWTFRKILGTSA